MKVDFYFGQDLISSAEAGDSLAKIPVKAPGKAGRQIIRFSLPILDFQGFWIPEERVPSSRIIWVIQGKSAAQRNFPYMAFFNSKQENRASIALSNLYDDVQIDARMNQQECTYDITITVAVKENTGDYVLTLDRRGDLLWTEALADWVKSLNIATPAFPDNAWDPVFCTWYAVHGMVNQDWVERIAPEAVRLGFKTLIIDDGWSYDDMKRVSPQTITTWYNSIGNWTVSDKKFPDFANHVKRIQKAGMHYMLWVAPFLIGKDSDIAERFSKAVFPADPKEGCRTFDSAHEKESGILLDKLGTLMEKYQLDGLKVDFLDYIFPNIERSRGRETLHFIEQLSKRIRAAKADALIEFRQSYATPQMLAYGTQFRAGDVPFDYEDNFARLCQIRISLGGGDGVPVHADPVYWHPQESPVNIARHMIASLAGVPMISMDLNHISEQEKEIIAHWTAFYQEHLDFYRKGHWEAAYHPSGASWLKVTLGNESMVIVHDEARLVQALEKAADKVYVLNLSPEELALSGALTSGPDGHAARPGHVPCGGMGIIG